MKKLNKEKQKLVENNRTVLKDVLFEMLKYFITFDGIWDTADINVIPTASMRL